MTLPTRCIGRYHAHLCWLIVLASSVVFVGAIPVTAGQGRPPEESVLLSIALPDRPGAAFAAFAQRCADCHTLGVRGAAMRPLPGPDLGRLPVKSTVMDLASAFWNHGPLIWEQRQSLDARKMTEQDVANIIGVLGQYRYFLTAAGDMSLTRPGDPTEGRRVFMAKSCATCHDPDTSAWTRKYRTGDSPIFLALAMWNHAPSMPGTRFAPGEMDDLMAFVQGRGVDEFHASPLVAPGSPLRGRQLFSSKGCITCHAVNGKGGRVGPDLATRGRDRIASVATIAGEMVNHRQAMGREFERPGSRPIAFSGQEMVDVIGYLYFLSYANVRGVVSAGERVFTQKCSTCHTAGGGKSVGPDLAAIRHLDGPISVIAAMWNHAPKMSREVKNRGLDWPRLEHEEAADLTAFLLTRRDAASRSRH